jgi:transcriptional accessory protein Tex/SPT6
MNEKHLNKIADELSLSLQQVKAAARLLKEGSTVPFIARYRKEVTDSLDEVAITAIRDKMAQMEALDNPRIRTIAVIAEGKGTEANPDYVTALLVVFGVAVIGAIAIGLLPARGKEDEVLEQGAGS